jgi:hypothetical protein
MSDSNTTTQPTRWSRRAKLFITLLIIGAVLSLVWSQLPRGAYPTDLSRVGEGRPALVLAYDMNYASGMGVMELMNAIRADYAGEVDFLVAHLGMPDGEAFARQHAAGDGTVLLFSADGRRVSTLRQPQTADALRQALDEAFGS